MKIYQIILKASKRQLNGEESYTATWGSVESVNFQTTGVSMFFPC